MSAEATAPPFDSGTNPILVPYHQDPLALLANLIIDRHARALPDLSQCAVLLPDNLAAPRLRRHLLSAAARHGMQALLGPQVLSLRQWAARHGGTAAAPLSPQARELLLVENLRQHRALFGDGDPWRLAADLAHLFGELTLHRVSVPSELHAFITRLRGAYGVSGTLSALSDEARLVHTLWQAWHHQLREERRSDPETAYLTQLDHSLAQPVSGTLYLAGYTQLSAPERRWARELMRRGTLSVIVHGEHARDAAGGSTSAPHPAQLVTTLLGDEDITAPATAAATPPPFSRFLDAAYAPREMAAMPKADALFAVRARRGAEALPASPAAERLRIYRAASAEDEARAIDIQTRRWLLDGHARIGIVTEDRRLARRLRALLERAEVTVHDAAGWALSTTAAAAALERWLETLEEDFAYRPLTDLLKSPFVFPAQERAALLAAVHRFEQDIVIHENVGRGMQRYRAHLAYRRARLSTAAGSAVQGLLDAVEAAAKPLLPFLRDTRRHPPTRILDALETSLRALGLYDSFSHDAAGQRVLQELAAMKAALQGRSLPMGWRDFRTWLGRTLERFNFQAPSPPAAVHLLSLEQSALADFDALIIAGANAEHLPGSGEASPFFNDAVRAELGLPASRARYTQRFYFFRRLLECAPRVLITLQREDNGEERLPSPWLEVLSEFHALAYGDDLGDSELAALVNHPAAEVLRTDSLALPAPRSRPAPALAADLLPRKISASAYQQMVDCPYQFFAARGLRLSAPETVREALEKSDYGERVHLVLQAFHGGRNGYPGPFAAPLTLANRAEALALLETISRAVFARDLEDNFMHRGWLQRWLARIPEYIDWQIERQRHWRVHAVEVSAERALQPGRGIAGRVDRVDQNADGQAIIDYKTGGMPNMEAVETGEAVQLPFYALLAEGPVQRVEYLGLDRQVKSHAVLEGEALTRLAADNGERLLGVLDQIGGGAALPAWGDDVTCGYCVMRGLCRKDTWPAQTASAGATAPR